MKLRNLLVCSLFTAIIVVGAFIRISTGLIPITFQVLFVIFTGLLLPQKLAAIPPAVYIALGLIGIPIFAQGGGFSYVFQPSFGFLLGFIVLAYLVSLLVRPCLLKLISKDSNQKKSTLKLKMAVYAMLSLAALYIIGVGYMYIVVNFYMGKSAALGNLIVTYTGWYLLFDIVKFAICIPLSVAVLRRMPNIITA